MVKISGGASNSGSQPSLENKLNTYNKYQQNLTLGTNESLTMNSMKKGTLTFLHVNVVGTASQLVVVLCNATKTYASGAIPASGNLELFTAFVWEEADVVTIKNVGGANTMAVNVNAANIEGTIKDLEI